MSNAIFVMSAMCYICNVRQVLYLWCPPNAIFVMTARCYVAADVDMDGKVDGSEFSGMIEVAVVERSISLYYCGNVALQHCINVAL